MKKVLFKELFRSIWKTKTRFLSILAIIAVGTGFFAGVKVSCPDMKLTAQKYFSDTRLMDLHLVSTLGFSEDDLAAVRETEGIRGMMPAYSVDAFVQGGEDQNMIVKALSLPLDGESRGEDYLNRPVLKEGRLPLRANECVIERDMLSDVGLRVGDTVTLFLEDDGLKDTLRQDTFTIVGVVESSQYISFTRGNSLIGDGVIDAFLLIPEEAFSLEVYTDVYLTLDSVKDVSPFEEEYDALVEETAAKLTKTAELRAKARYEEIKDEAQAEIDKAKAELADGEKEAEKELSAAEQELKAAKAKLDAGKKEYEEGLSTFRVEIADAKKQITAAKEKLSSGQKEYEEGLKQYEDGLAQFEEEKPAALAQIAAYEKQAAELAQTLADGKEQIAGAKQVVAGIPPVLDAFADQSIPNPALFPQEIKTLLAALEQLEQSQGAAGLSQMLSDYIITTSTDEKTALRAGIETGVASINAAIKTQEEELAQGETGLKQLQDGIAQGKAALAQTEQTLKESREKLDAAKAELESGAKALAEQEPLLKEKEAEGQKELDAAQTELAQGEKEYKDGLAAYQEGKAESDQKLSDARAQIKDAENQLAELAEPTWYVWDRDNNSGYANYQQDAEKVDAIAKVFPVFFVLVAALVCLTTMTRMVEEERTQIGTLKALGYGRGSIIAKYLLYATAASIAGCAVGLTIGFQLFPRVIISAYGILYNLPDPLTPFRWDYTLVCTVVAVLCTGLSALAACYKELMTCPAQLMRPRAPKSGKRVLLERVSFLWNKFSFIHKVTVRNIFRYKRRVLMTVIGVAGCTALLLTGFGLRFSISEIAGRQYGNVFVYDALAVTEEKGKELQSLREKMDANPSLEGYIGVTHKTMDATDGEVVKSVNLYVPEDAETFKNYIHLQERVGKKELTLQDGGVVITEKLSKQLSAGEGDTITLNNPDGRPVTVTVTGVAENYAMNYVYMTEADYIKNFRTDPQVNTFLLNIGEDVNTERFSEELLGYGGILGMSYSEDGLAQFSDTISSLDSIIWVLIISAGALAIIVMYNLVNINVNERVRELATIKVLGFYDKEVSAYIYRENNIAAAVGMLVGLFGGVFLERFVIVTAEVDEVMFAPDIGIRCFVFAALLTILFTLIVNITLHFQLKRISMVESLKSIE